MKHLWTWGVRNPAAFLAVLAALAGWQGIAAWSLAWTTVLAFALLAELGHRLARRARRREAKKQAAIEALAATALLREQLRTAGRRAA